MPKQPPNNEGFSVNALALKLETDRRTLRRALTETTPSGHGATGPLYLIEDATRALVAHRKRTARRMSPDRKRNLLLQNERLQVRIEILRGDRVHAAEVEKRGAAVGAAVRNVVTQIHRIAPSIVGLSVADAEARLRDLESDILEQLRPICPE